MEDRVECGGLCEPLAEGWGRCPGKEHGFYCHSVGAVDQKCQCTDPVDGGVDSELCESVG